MTQTKNCQNCKKDFQIVSEDFAFYEKMKVPPPTWCPPCRQQRRLVWRNERTLYHRQCDLCKKQLISMYASSVPFPVYCSECWWADTWSALDYSQEPDFEKPFFEQFADLQCRIPRLYLDAKNNENSDFTNISFNNKNCYLAFGSVNSEDLYYGRKANRCKNSIDISNSLDMELCYECIDAQSCFNSLFLQDCKQCMDSLFLYNCRGCSNCAFCCNLNQKQYCIFNKQLTKDEYSKKLKDFCFASRTALERSKQEFENFKRGCIHRSNQNLNCENCLGEYLSNCISCSYCFDVVKGDNCKWVTDSLGGVIDSRDCLATTTNCEQMYECANCTTSKICFFSHGIRDKSHEIYYSDYIFASNNLFGCVGLRGVEYCILNKSYSKDAYGSLKDRLIEHMKETGEFGHFFPPALSPFCYNESLAMQFLPLSKEQALQGDFRWQDSIPYTRGKGTLAHHEMPDSINDIDEKILSHILACIECGKNYKIIKQEFSFYKKQNIAYPQYCSDCRYLKRMSLRRKRELWHRQCMNRACTNEFETTYAPDRPEIIYCETCYQKEVV